MLFWGGFAKVIQTERHRDRVSFINESFPVSSGCKSKVEVFIGSREVHWETLHHSRPKSVVCLHAALSLGGLMLLLCLLVQ